MISFNDFAKLELKVGTVLEAEEVEGSERLIKLKVDIGEEGPRQIFAGIKTWYDPQDLVNKQVIVVTNLEPKRMMNEYSEGMILAADSDKPILLKPSSKVTPGTKIR